MIENAPFSSSPFSHLDDVNNSDDVRALKNEIFRNVRHTTLAAEQYLKSFTKYDYVWLEDKHLHLKSFLKECEQKHMEDDECSEEDECDPNLQIELFQNQVKR